MTEFTSMQRLPPYVFTVVDELKQQIINKGQTVIDFSMGNPDQATPDHIVQAMVDAAQQGTNHRYSVSKGVMPLRQAICDWYQRRFNVDLDANHEAIVTIGSKEGLSHLALATIHAGDHVIAPNPCYPIHRFGFLMAGAVVHDVPQQVGPDFFKQLVRVIEQCPLPPKFLILNFPANPTAHCVDLAFMEEAVRIAKHYGVYLVHDFAYAELVFDGYQAPSVLQVPGAKDIAVETYSLSKTYNMPGWRVGFVCGNAKLIQALARLKNYLDYGLFAPVEKGAIAALTGSQQCVQDICHMYQQRRDLLCDGLNNIGWQVDKPQASMFVWAEIPQAYKAMHSLQFCQYVLEQTGVALSPGVGFGSAGDDYVRFALIQDQQAMAKAMDKLAVLMQDDTLADLRLSPAS